ncbi:hypothetical protein [Asticcacaulis sp.]|jgi:hypothetical protein|uniref:hypothetical protein n=1 Tax=Asticcacaulis sp. TaxID=1872648 RepID=UPI003F7C8C80
MIDLHERLSEFSYGFGITREMEARLADQGVHATPFLPNLRDEKKLAFDVGFKDKGVIVLLQFKLGHELQRFRAGKAMPTKPELQRPFWRFPIDTSGTQFKILERHEKGGARVLYAAPRFKTWREYDTAFQTGKILEKSLMIKPSEIVAKLKVSDPKSVAGPHRVVYDDVASFVCSEPVPIKGLSPEAVVNDISDRAGASDRTLAQLLNALYDDRRKLTAAEKQRDQDIFSQANQREDALLEILSKDALAQGAQMLFATKQVNN